jgi:hypothetical protein
MRTRLLDSSRLLQLRSGLVWGVLGSLLTVIGPAPTSPAAEPRSPDSRGPGSGPRSCLGLLHVPFPQSLELLRATDAGLGDQYWELARMRELARMASRELLTSAERLVLDSEYQARLFEVDRISILQSFHEIPLLDGSLDVCLGGGPPLAPLIYHDLPETTPFALDLDGSNLTTASNAQTALVIVEHALRSLTSFREEQREAWWLLVHG